MKRAQTPSFLLELPLQVTPVAVRHLHGHFEAGRSLYNALLGEAMQRLRRMRADPRWQAARSMPRAQKQERQRLYARLRDDYGFSEYALHRFAKAANCAWIADHLDAVTAQTLATGAYHTANRLALGHAKKVRFKSKNRFDSLEGKRNDTGIRFVLQSPAEGNQGWLVWGKDRIPALIDYDDEVVAIVPREGEARLEPLCAELAPDARKRRRLQRKLDRKLRANNPHNYDDKGRIKKHGKQRLHWKQSRCYQATQRRLATQERKLAAHRKALHGRLIHEILRVGNQIHLEKLSYKGWQKGLLGKSVGIHAPGQFIARLKLTVASTGGSLVEFPTFTTKLSQYCHGCQATVKKPLSQRFHHCSCGIGPVQRDLYSAFLVAFLDTADQHPSSVRYDEYWNRSLDEGTERR